MLMKVADKLVEAGLSSPNHLSLGTTNTGSTRDRNLLSSSKGYIGIHDNM